MKKRVLTVVPNELDATAFYRSSGVIPQLREMMPDFAFYDSNKINWSSCYGADIVFLQRPFNDDHLKATEIALNANAKLWVDYDDDLFCVPEGNPAHKFYGNDGVKKNVSKILARADLVTVSTHRLKEKFAALNKNIHVVPNAFNDHLINYRPDHTNEKHQIVLWRGSATHDRDLATYLEAMYNASSAYPQWFFVFVGDVFWKLKEVMPKKNCVYIPPADPMVYWRDLARMRPAIQIVPLEDSEFNRAKSNIAWIEGSYAGAACLVPDWKEWQNPGAVTYQSPADFERLLKNMLKNPGHLPQMAEQSWKHICENLSLTVVNKQRAQLLEDLSKKVKKFGCWQLGEPKQSVEEQSTPPPSESESISSPQA
jgi:hypothetical protein